MSENFNSTVKSLFKGMEDMVSTKTVVGQAIEVGDTTIIPLCDVSFGMIASNKAESHKKGEGGGLGGKVQPNAVLIVKDGTTRLVSVKDQDVVSKVAGLVPDVVNYFSGLRAKNSDADVKDAVEESAKEEKF